MNTVLEPITVKIQDKFGNGLPRRLISFSVVSGVAELSTARVPTSDNGTASVTVTLGNEPGIVEIEAASQLFTVTVVATATSQ